MSHTVSRRFKFIQSVIFLFSTIISSSAMSSSDLDGREDFAQIARGGFSYTVDGNFFGGVGYPSFPNLIANSDGSPRNSYAWSMEWFDGQLYVGTNRDLLCGSPETASLAICDGGFETRKGEIWRYTPSATDSGLSGSWARIYQSPSIGEDNPLVNVFAPDQADFPRDFGYRTMTTCDAGGINRLYAATYGIPGNILYYNGSSFSKASIDGLNAGILQVQNGTADPGYRPLVCFKGRLWTSPVGTYEDPDASNNPVVLMNPDPAGSGAWQAMVNVQTDATFGDSDNGTIFQMATIGDALYVSVGNRETGLELWKGDGSNCGIPPASCTMSWSKIIDNGAARPDDGGTLGIDNAGATLGVYDGKLYLGAADSGYNELTTSELLRADPATDTWEVVIGYPRRDNSTIPNFNCATPVDIPAAGIPGFLADADSDVDDCNPLSGKGPGLGILPYYPGPISYFWRFAEHDGSLFIGTLEIFGALLGQPGGFDLLRSDNGVSWEAIDLTGLGNESNYGGRSMVSIPGLGLAIGTANPFSALPTGGAEVWIGTTDPTVPPLAVIQDLPVQHGTSVDVTLDGTESNDPFGGTLTNYEWFDLGVGESVTPVSGNGGDCTSLSGTLANGSSASTYEATALTAGSADGRTVYNYALRVTDDDSNKACASNKVIVSSDLPPEAVITTTPVTVPGEGFSIGNQVVHLADFDGNGSETFDLTGECTDPEGRLASCQWTVGSGITLADSNSLDTTVTATLPSSFFSTITLTATDAPFRYMDTDNIQVVISGLNDIADENDSPVCRSSSFEVQLGDTLVIDPTSSIKRLCQDPDDADNVLTYAITGGSDAGLASGGSSISFTPDTAGAADFTFKASDDEAASSPSVGVFVTVISAPGPAAPSTPDLSTGSDSGDSTTDNITNDNTPTFTGTSQTGVDIELFAGTTSIGTDTDQDGSWSITSSVLTEGEHSITARATNGSGTTSSSPLVVKIDTIAPSVAVTNPANGDSFVSVTAFNAICTAASGDVCGNASDSGSGLSKVALTGSGTGFSAGNATGVSSGDASANWSHTVTGTKYTNYQVTATAHDVAGNMTETSAVSFSILGYPDAPSTPDLDTASDSGDLDMDNVTNDDTPTFSGTAEAGTTVDLLVGGVSKGSIVATSGSWQITSTTLTDGVHSVTAKSTNANGSTTSAALSVRIDTTDPEVDISNPTMGQNFDSVADFNAVCTAATGDICGSASDGGSGLSKVAMTGSGTGFSAGNAIIATGTWKHGVAGNWGAAYSVTATAHDVAGNTKSDTVSFDIDAERIHVADLDGTTEIFPFFSSGTISIKTENQSAAAMQNATVSYDLNGKAGSCLTGAGGSCTATGLSKGVGTITLTVSGISHASAAYESTENDDPEADSDGTTIVLTP